MALRRGRVSLPGQIYHVTTTTHDRTPCFRDFRTACLVARSFHDTDLVRDARLLAWVLMPDHAHWLIELGNTQLGTVVGNLKSASARAVNRELHRDGRIWARAYQDHALRRDEDVITVARYIVANPLRAGLVQRVGDYPFWNTVWL